MNKKRKREEISNEEIPTLIKGKKATKLEKVFKGRNPTDLLPTHESEISPIIDYKISYQIRQTIKTKSILECNNLISLVKN